MAVKISKLWSSAKFQKLANESRLLYIYLATNPDIDVVGVSCPNMDVLPITLKMSVDVIRESTRELIGSGFIHVGKYENEIYFVVLDHFNTIPKSDSAVARVHKALLALPEGLKNKLSSFGIETNRKAVVFKEPTAEEISRYAMSQGYLIDAQKVIDFYKKNAEKRNVTGWVDSRGKQIKDWKSKLRLVWFRDEHKLKEVEGAPKGYEYFYIMFEDRMVFPESWRKGKPHSKNLSVKKALEKEYEKRKESS